jgi:hypothetical protein
MVIKTEGEVAVLERALHGALEEHVASVPKAAL